MLTFEHDGKRYAIDFQREHKKVRVRDKQTDNVFRFKKSQHPFTTVYITEVEAGVPSKYWNVKYFAEVGCLPGDPFTNAEGRLQALRKLSPTLPKELRRKVWETYTHRRQPVKKEGVTDATNTKVLAGS